MTAKQILVITPILSYEVNYILFTLQEYAYIFKYNFKWYL